MQHMFTIILVLVIGLTNSFFVHRHHNIIQPFDISDLINTIKGKELAVIQFGTTRCRHSNHLQHTLNELPKYFNDTSVVFLFVDCKTDNFTAYCMDYGITKFPTVKMIYLGVQLKTEYRGQRTVQALKEYIESLIDNDVPILTDADKLEDIRPDKNHRYVMGFFPSESHETFLAFKKISGVFHKQCYFYAFINDVQQLPIIAIRDSALGDEVYTGQHELNAIFMWARENCKPLVPEMTFGNAEEIIEEKIPLLILYRNTSDMDTVNQFTKVVNSEIRDMINNNVIAVHVDGSAFKNALRFANMTLEDLPVIQIDTFQTYSILSNFTEILQSGNLRKFVRDSLDKPGIEGDSTDERKSIYLKLQPSSKRYSFIADNLTHDEL